MRTPDAQRAIKMMKDIPEEDLSLAQTRQDELADLGYLVVGTLGMEAATSETKSFTVMEALRTAYLLGLGDGFPGI